MTAGPVLGMDLENLGPVEWVVVGLSAVAAVWVIVKAVKLTLHPGEEEPDHVKRVIFQESPESKPSAPPASLSPVPPPFPPPPDRPGPPPAPPGAG